MTAWTLEQAQTGRSAEELSDLLHLVYGAASDSLQWPRVLGGPLVFSAITGGTQTQHWRGGGIGRSLISLTFLFTFQTGIVTPH
jgi:hypothetical protein